MPSLKQYRDRIKSVVSTRKITSAMKMVAASKLRRAQELSLSSRPYGEFMERLMSDLSSHEDMTDAHPLLVGNGKSDTHLVIVATADRGLCGGFNASIVRRARLLYQLYAQDGKTVKFLCIGRKGYDLLRREFKEEIFDHITGIGKTRVSFAEVDEIAQKLIAWFEDGEFDVCTIIYNTFISAISQEVTEHQLIPVVKNNTDHLTEEERLSESADYDYEPSREELLEDLLPRNIAVQIYRALLENAASEQGARMAAMDAATRNAGELIKRLKLDYNRKRQEFITNELIDIVSGANTV